MTSFELLKLLGNAQDSYIMDSRKRPRKPAKPPVARIAALAACAAVVIAAGSAIVYLKPWAFSTPSQGGETLSTSPSAPVSEDSTGEDLPTAAPSSAPLPESITLLAAADPPAPPQTDEEASQNWSDNAISDDTRYAVNAFSYRLAAKALSGQDESQCVSPLSLYESLSILASGAEGSTRDQLLSLLGQGDTDTLVDEAGRLYRVNQKDLGPDLLKTSNSLWLDEKQDTGEAVGYHQDWGMAAAANLYCDVYAADFGTEDTDQALGLWISQHTGGLMDSALHDLSFSENTAMAIVNTVWYQAQWHVEFDAEKTASGTFTTASGEAVSCDYMHKTDPSGDAIVTDTYIKSGLMLSTGTMYFVLPRDGVSVEELLQEDTLWEIFENNDYTDAELHWSIPKFETSTMSDYADTLKAMGLTDVFSDGSPDFSGIADSALYLSQALQGTHISINEQGVAASSFTALEGELASAPNEDPQIIEMDLNKPFLYLITSDSGTPLFIGVVRTPVE